MASLAGAACVPHGVPSNEDIRRAAGFLRRAGIGPQRPTVPASQPAEIAEFLHALALEPGHLDSRCLPVEVPCLRYRDRLDEPGDDLSVLPVNRNRPGTS
jgi:hypothetical protein